MKAKILKLKKHYKTQRATALAIGCSGASVSRILAGVRGLRPSVEFSEKVNKAMDKAGLKR